MRAIAALVSAAGLLSAAIIAPAFAQQPKPPLKIGLLDDFSSVYSHIGGVMDLEGAKMAIEDFGGVMFGKPIELVSADAQNKPDIAASIARKWWETEGVDMIVGLPTSATALAVMQVRSKPRRS
jgi:branched-chain amino acid transport system substrate-binding protein